MNLIHVLPSTGNLSNYYCVRNCNFYKNIALRTFAKSFGVQSNIVNIFSSKCMLHIRSCVRILCWGQLLIAQGMLFIFPTQEFKLNLNKYVIHKIWKSYLGNPKTVKVLILDQRNTPPPSLCCCCLWKKSFQSPDNLSTCLDQFRGEFLSNAV